VGEVAGVVVGDDHLDRVALRLGLVLGQQLVDVAHLRREGRRPFAPLGVVAEQMAVVLHGRAAARGVDDDRVAVLEHRDRLARLVARVDPRVELQRAAAARLGRRPDLEPLGRQHADGDRVDVAEEDALDAALQEADAAALGALRGGELGQRDALGARRRELGHRLQAREAPQEARRGAGQRRERGDPLHPVGVREEGEDRLAAQALAAGARPAPLDLSAGVLDELVVLHA
jgi:hypothetical protein